MTASRNETGTASFLGTSTSGGGDAAVKAALDTIFAHENIAPFLSKQLIQRLVTSNPSAGYVGRVSAAFADNGKGVRGDMQAVIRAILSMAHSLKLQVVAEGVETPAQWEFLRRSDFGGQK